ncbi:hypothetical protein HMPREF3034_01500 [Prevotella sp. DNF00663]|uniref:DUF3332 domain-containing protein n=1 Tax=unclassified Prevotella TaxID=2638335 RepID=UPI000512B5C7|nr:MULTISPECIES: DUF3332 domain-containing protein [unclassified Prevotella]KGI60337.1 membrane protein [Prevotella sp. S7 MS 2]KXB82749.1 hypothetical protein HMPREF3034_01500 [Prevotella sp. DNF00663]
MKMKHLGVVAGFMAATLLSTSCVGSFSLFNKLAHWNKGATNSKFLNELIFLIISPAYGVCTLVDALVLNTMEFWTGSNPIAQNVGKTQEVMGQDGRYYAVKTLKDGYEITKPTGEKLYFVYNQETKTWSQKQDGKTTDIFTFNDDGTIQAHLGNGKDVTVTQDEAGVYKLKMATGMGTYWAMR